MLEAILSSDLLILLIVGLISIVALIFGSKLNFKLGPIGISLDSSNKIKN
jgi:hypothetical protein